MAIGFPLLLCGNMPFIQADSVEVRVLGARTDSLYFAAQPSLALSILEDRLSAGLDHAQLRWRAARAAIAMGMLVPDGPERRTSYDRALQHARRGLELAPADLGARYWLAAAAGRRVHRSDPVYSTRLAREVYEHATAILALDSTHAGAHHAMGMLHAGVLRVPRLIRFLAARVLRSDLLERANWIDAERHLKHAVALEPEMVVYVADLTDFYVRLKRLPEAHDFAARLAVIPARHPMDDERRSTVLARLKRSSEAGGNERHQSLHPREKEALGL